MPGVCLLWTSASFNHLVFHLSPDNGKIKSPKLWMGDVVLLISSQIWNNSFAMRFGLLHQDAVRM